MNNTTVNTYFMKAGPFVKIGKSINPMARVKELQTGCPYVIDIVHVIQADMEQKMHHIFHEYRRNGEWFNLNGKLKRYLDRRKQREEDDVWVPDLMKRWGINDRGLASLVKFSPLEIDGQYALIETVLAVEEEFPDMSWPTLRELARSKDIPYGAVRKLVDDERLKATPISQNPAPTYRDDLVVSPESLDNFERIWGPLSWDNLSEMERPYWERELTAI
jgi:hypothetical protein